MKMNLYEQSLKDGYLRFMEMEFKMEQKLEVIQSMGEQIKGGCLCQIFEITEQVQVINFSKHFYIYN